MQLWFKNETDGIFLVRIVGVITDKTKHLRGGELMIEDVPGESDIGIMIKPQEVWATIRKVKKNF